MGGETGEKAQTGGGPAGAAMGGHWAAGAAAAEEEEEYEPEEEEGEEEEEEGDSDDEEDEEGEEEEEPEEDEEEEEGDWEEGDEEEEEMARMAHEYLKKHGQGADWQQEDEEEEEGEEEDEPYVHRDPVLQRQLHERWAEEDADEDADGDYEDEDGEFEGGEDEDEEDEEDEEGEEDEDGAWDNGFQFPHGGNKWLDDGAAGGEEEEEEEDEDEEDEPEDERFAWDEGDYEEDLREGRTALHGGHPDIHGGVPVGAMTVSKSWHDGGAEDGVSVRQAAGAGTSLEGAVHLYDAELAKASGQDAGVEIVSMRKPKAGGPGASGSHDAPGGQGATAPRAKAAAKTPVHPDHGYGMCDEFKKDTLPVYVVESHNHVLLPYYQAANCGLLESGVTVVHFDSHADYLLPEGGIGKEMPKTLEEMHKMVQETDIGTFYAPLWYQGLVKHVIWVRSEFERGNYNDPSTPGTVTIRIGKNAEGQFCVTPTPGHDIVDLECDDPIDAREVMLTTTVMSEVMHPTWFVSGPVVLDIDLDYYASEDPVISRFVEKGLTASQVRKLRHALMAILEDNDTCQHTAEQEQRIINLQRHIIFHHMGGVGPRRIPAQLLKFPAETLGFFCGGPKRAEALLHDLATSVDDWRLEDQYVRMQFKSIFVKWWEQIMENFQAEEPAHQASSDEILTVSRNIGELISRGAIKPALVTICRSVDDHYTPRPSWPEIEWSLISAVQESAKDHSPVIAYEPGIALCPLPETCFRKKRPEDCFKFHFA